MSDGFEKFDAQKEPSHSGEKIELLETKLTKLENRLNEERFYWVFGIVILINMAVFPHMDNSWGGPVSITILEFIGLVVLARKCGVDFIVEITYRLLDGWSKTKKR